MEPTTSTDFKKRGIYNNDCSVVKGIVQQGRPSDWCGLFLPLEADSVVSPSSTNPSFSFTTLTLFLIFTEMVMDRTQRLI
jgi:hypothetical protein